MAVPELSQTPAVESSPLETLPSITQEPIITSPPLVKPTHGDPLDRLFER